MKPRHLVVAYLSLSLAILLFVKPGYNYSGGLLLLISGPASGALLIFQGYPDIYSEDLLSGTQFSSDLLVMCIVTGVLWLAELCTLGAWNAPQSRIAFRMTAIVLWLIGSVYNSFWFAIRSL